MARHRCGRHAWLHAFDHDRHHCFRPRRPQGVLALFQPHLYSRTAEHGDAMGEALAGADLAVVTDVYGAREAPLPGVTGEQVVDAARRRGASVVYEPSRGALGERVASLLRSGDVLLTLGAGDITRLGSEVRERLGSA